MCPSVWPGVKASRTLPSPNTSTARPNVANESIAAGLEVDRAVVEGVVELAPDVAVHRRAATLSSRTPTPASENRNVAPGNSDIALAWSECRWVITTVPIWRRLDPARAQLRGRPRRDASIRGWRNARVQPAQVLLRVDRDRGVEARCRPGSGRRSGARPGTRGWGPPHAQLAADEAERAQRRPAVPPRAWKNAAGARRGGRQQRVQADGRALAAARQAAATRAGARRACGCSLPTAMDVAHLPRPTCLHDQVVIVTGGGTGLGRATAIELAGARRARRRRRAAARAARGDRRACAPRGARRPSSATSARRSRSTRWSTACWSATAASTRSSTTPAAST